MSLGPTKSGSSVQPYMANASATAQTKLPNVPATPSGSPENPGQGPTYTTPQPRATGSALPALSTLPYERACKVIWPFNGLRRPMGTLFDEGRITHRDLGWASGASNIDSDI